MRAAAAQSNLAALIFGSIVKQPNTVIASEAKQSMLHHKERMDCFAEPVIGRAFARPVGSQ
jgi:hypothetical protein